MDDPTREFLSTFQRFMTDVVNQVSADTRDLTPLGELVEDFLGAEVAGLSGITHPLAAHRLVDADLALAELARQSPEPAIGVSGGQHREHMSLSELLSSPFGRFSPAPVDYLSIADGPATTRRVIAFGLHRLRFEGEPIVVLQRAAQPQFGRETAQIEILSADTEVGSRFLREFTRLMVSLSVLRGKVLSFNGGQFGHSAAGATFLERPDVEAEAVVLAPGVLDSVVRHVVGIGEHRDALLAAGQHLKRGVLLYGPPGTGKTLTVRHLLSRTPNTTAVLLTGSSIQFIGQAAELARAMQPAIVVLEDVDLVAEERGMHGPQPLLFAVLDALDGLDGDADITFILTTNRVSVLERALAERPGRIDLAVEIPLPDPHARRRLFARYAAELPFSAEAVDAAADRAIDTTGSFAKELMRSAVLTAAEQGRPPVDADLDNALDRLLESSSQLARNLLGGGASPDADTPDPNATWSAHAPL